MTRRVVIAEGDAVLLIMDDRAGRLEAKSHGLSLIGTAAVIDLAKTEGHSRWRGRCCNAWSQRVST